MKNDIKQDILQHNSAERSSQIMCFLSLWEWCWSLSHEGL